MTTTKGPQEHAVEKPVDKAQYLVCAVLVAVGAFLIYDALSLEAGFAKVDPVGPRIFPIAVGVGLIVLAAMLALAIPRGSTGEEEGGEDIDTSTPADWRTVGLLVGLFIATIVLVVPLGWAITGTMLFAGAATILGSKRYVLNLIIGVVLAVGSFYAFYSGLGIPLPAGILDGIL
jgi:putative tricarboxylic transport membrane protein